MQILLGEGLCFSLRLSSKAGVLGGARAVSLARRGSSFRKERNRSAEENLLPSAERKNCVRTQGNFRAHENIFLCARNLSALPKRSFPYVLCLLFPLRIALRSQGVYLGVFALQRKALQPIGRYCPISRIFAFHKGLVGRIPLSRGEPSNDLPTNQRQRC